MTTISDAPCLTCGKSVQIPKGQGQRQRGKKYCGKECYHASLKGKPSNNLKGRRATCVVCGNECGKGSKKYCSRECYLAAHTADNTTPELELLRNSAKYRAWRTAVFERDDYTCQECGQRGAKLNADHIKTFAYHPELRFDVGNGRTLCVSCHKDTDTYGFKAWRNRATVDATGY